MARKELKEDKKEQAKALFAIGANMNEVAKKLHISNDTAKRLKEALEKDPDYIEYREQKKREFIDKAWEVVNLATEQAKLTIGKAGPGEAAKVAGIFYDKIALACGEATGRHEVTGHDGKPFEVNIKVVD